MARASSKIAEATTTPDDEMTIDPFAADVFGEKATLYSEETTREAAEGRLNNGQAAASKKRDWYLSLPRLTNRDAEFSGLLRNFPRNITNEAAAKMEEVVARCTFRPSENVHCEVISISEININESIGKLSKSPTTFLTIRCEPEDTVAILAVDTALASSLIDIVLEGKPSEFSNPRLLSPIETTIIEFLAIKILGEINNWLGKPLFVLRGVDNAIDIPFDSFDRGGEAVFSLELDSLRGIISLFGPQSFLKALDRSRNPLLVTGSRTLEDFEKIVPELDVRLLVGRTSLDSDSLLFLEADDIVLIDQPEIQYQGAAFTGDLQVYAGRGMNFRLTGTVVDGGTENALPDQITVKDIEITSEEERRVSTPARSIMDEKENELVESEQAGADIEPASEVKVPDNEMPASLENVQIGLRAEIAANKLSLRELRDLRSGQIIGLGCRPTDPVRLMADNNEHPIATGELVEIEGQLGVRLTRVFI